MDPLKFTIITLTLLVQGGSSRETVDVFSHPEQEATLPCRGPSSSGPQGCSGVSWLFNRDSDKTFNKVRGGNVVPGSRERLSLNPDCSLVVRNVRTEDVGLYTCRQNEDSFYDVAVYLSVLTVRSDQAVSDGGRDGEVLLECSLIRYKGLTVCESNGLRWVDESRNELKGAQKSSRGGDCLSHLSVKLQSGSSRRLSCQFVSRANQVEIEAEYTAGFKDPGPALTPVPEPDPAPEPGPDLTFVIIGVLLGVLLLLVVSSAVLIKHRRGGAKVTQDVQTPTQPPDEPESDLTYVTVSHIQHQEKKRKRKKRTVKEEEKEKEEEEEEEVTYSAVRSGVRTETDDDPSSLYSNISRPK